MKIHTLVNLYHFRPMVLGERLTPVKIQFMLQFAPMSYPSYSQALKALAERTGLLKAR